MERVTGIGGIFMACKDSRITAEWYKKHLGLDINLDAWTGTMFRLKNEVDRQEDAYQLVNFTKENNDYFKPGNADFMLNLRVANLDWLLEELKKEGVALAGEPLTESYGKFAWVIDPDGRKVELWEQV